MPIMHKIQQSIGKIGVSKTDKAIIFREFKFQLERDAIINNYRNEYDNRRENNEMEYFRLAGQGRLEEVIANSQ